MTDGASLANVYLQLIPSMAGAQKTIAAELSPIAEKAGDQAGAKGGKRFGASFKAGMAGFLGGAVVTKLISGVVDFARESIESLGRVETINTQTESVIASTGGAAQVTAKQVEDLAGRLEGLTATEAESIQEGANMLLTFKNIQNEGGKTGGIFDQTVVAATDMARAMGTDVKSASMMLGKALNDPATGLSKLSRAGVTFTEQQQEQIKAMANAGDTAGAQALMLAELNAQFGGSGEAYASTYAGQMELVGHAVGTLGETIMQAAMPALLWLAENGAKAFNWLAENQVVLGVVAGVIGGALVAAFVAWTASVWASTVALLANPMTWVVVGIVALIAAIVALVANWDTVVAWLKDVWDGAVKGVKAGLDWLAAQWSAIWGGIKDFFVGLWASIVQVVSDHVTAVRDTIAAVWGAVKTAWEAVWNGISSFFSGLWTGILKVATDHVNAVSSVISFVWTTVKKGWEIVWGGISSFFSGLWAGIKKIVTDHVGMVRSVIESVTGTIKKGWETVWGGIRDFASGVWGTIKKVVSDHIGAVRDVIVDIMGKIKSAWDTAWGGIKTIGETAWNWIRDTASTAFDTLKTKVETTIGKLKTGLETIWGGIRKVFATPINAVIGFINKGIVGGYNWVAGEFGLKKMSDLAKIPGYADGGWTGPGGKYKPAGIVHADEYVLTKAQVRAMGGPSGVADWLSHAGAPGYAGGGLVTYQGKRFTAIFAALLRKANEMAGGGMHISQGGFRPRTSYSGTSHQGDAVDITGNYRKFIAPLRSVGIPTWDRAGKGKWVDHAHGVPLPGFGSAAGSAVWQAQDYLRGGDGLGGRDNGPRGGVIMQAVKGLMEAIKAGFNSVKEWFDKIVEKITGPFKSFTSGVAGGPLGDLVKSVATKLKDELTKWVKDKLGVGYASGTSHASPGLAWVGERGPELVRFRGGEQVIPNHALGSSGGGNTYNVTLQLPNWVRGFDDMVAFLADFDRHAHAS